MKRLIFSLLLIGGCQASEVRVGFGDQLPPFCIEQSQSGIEVDVFREALAYRGHVLKPLFYPIKRVAIAFVNREVDGAMLDSGFDLRPYGGLYASPAVIYDNVFISVADRHISLTQPSDLHGLTVLAFPGALARYPEWLKPVQQAGKYSELNNQATQVSTLQSGRYDLVLSDRYIFRYFSLLQSKKGGKLRPVVEHDFVKPNPDDYRAIFRDPTVRADYEAGLAHLKNTGRYQAIYDKYLK